MILIITGEGEECAILGVFPDCIVHYGTVWMLAQLPGCILTLTSCWPVNIDLASPFVPGSIPLMSPAAEHNFSVLRPVTCSSHQQLSSPRRIRRREKLLLASKSWIQFSPTLPDSCGVDTSFPLSAVTYWNMHAQYFALINLDPKLQCCTNSSVSLLLILLDPAQWYSEPANTNVA